MSKTAEKSKPGKLNLNSTNEAKITDAMPTGKGEIFSGSHVALGIKDVFDYDIGTGVVTELTDYSLTAAGSYNFDIWGYKGSGTWNMSLNSTDNGQTYQVTIKFSGTFNENETYTANAQESGSGSDTEISYSGNDMEIVQSYQNDGVFQKAKVWFETHLNRHDVHLYVYNTDVYGN